MKTWMITCGWALIVIGVFVIYKLQSHESAQAQSTQIEYTRDGTQKIGGTKYGEIYYFKHEGRSCYVYESQRGSGEIGSISCVDGRETSK